MQAVSLVHVAIRGLQDLQWPLEPMPVTALAEPRSEGPMGAAMVLQAQALALAAALLVLGFVRVRRSFGPA